MSQGARTPSTSSGGQRAQRPSTPEARIQENKFQTLTHRPALKAKSMPRDIQRGPLIKASSTSPDEYSAQNRGRMRSESPEVGAWKRARHESPKGRSSPQEDWEPVPERDMGKDSSRRSQSAHMEQDVQDSDYEDPGPSHYVGSRTGKGKRADLSSLPDRTEQPRNPESSAGFDNRGRSYETSKSLDTSKRSGRNARR
ncbi:MAG: hypothetical protein M1828_005891 [Chrysothrix sp. TS-e1954]|nr:MAG: hypothetical protein M1828_005891 [Chrysothrix sp. TS-e1954]